ncbi:MAG: BrnA antitoxin family protein [Sulfuricella sp.]|nr:BrnA antitoxin family protein [Sulfuricella sp.]
MKTEYDFSNAKRGAVIPASGKTRITIFLDDDILEAFRARAEAQGKGYQTLINETLRAAIQPEHSPVTEESLRRVLREELRAA